MACRLRCGSCLTPLYLNRRLYRAPHSLHAFSSHSMPKTSKDNLAFATVNPTHLSKSNPHQILNLVGGTWSSASHHFEVVDPLNDDVFIFAPDTQENEFSSFIESLRSIPKSGRHNPLKHPERYVMYGEVFHKAASGLHDENIFQFFVKCIQRTMPKSYAQAAGEVKIVRKFLENFSGDSVRFAMRGFTVPGDHQGQQSCGYRWPFGPVAVISPFNFPLEIPVMQFLGAAMTGNKALVKAESTQGLVVEQFIRYLIHCGLPMDEIDLISIRGPNMTKLIERSPIRLIQFTGSSQTAAHLANLMNGRVKVEDSGFDWKILGPDVHGIDYVAWQCDQDAYSISGQKCSAQSMLLLHSNWTKAGILDKLKALASRRSLTDLTISPVLSHTNQEILQHINDLCSIPGAYVLFGGQPITNAKTPLKYGLFHPTAVFVPLDSILSSSQNFQIATTELFGPVQVVTEWKDDDKPKLLTLFERIQHHLTAAIVSSDLNFLSQMLGSTVNGTTYAGIRARTTGAPQNHWFGPAGNPLASGIGTPEAILSTWTCHREVVYDTEPIPEGWTTPDAS